MNETNIPNLLEQIKKNEKKSKIRMVFTLLISLCLGILTLYFAAKLNKSEENAIKLKNEFKKSSNNSISVIDTLTLLLKKCQSDGGKYSKEINTAIDKTEKQSYIIYMHDNTASGRLTSNKIKEKLEEKGYNIAGVVKIDRDFQTSVRYFHMDDLLAAKEIQGIIEEVLTENQNLQRVDLTPLLHLEAPRKQLEVWIKI